MAETYHIRLLFFKRGIAEVERTVKIEFAGEVLAESYPIQYLSQDPYNKISASEIPFLDAFEFTTTKDAYQVYPLTISTLDQDVQDTVVGIEDVLISLDGEDWRSFRANGSRNRNSDDSFFYPDKDTLGAWTPSMGHIFHPNPSYTFNLEILPKTPFDYRYRFADRTEQVATLIELRMFGQETKKILSQQLELIDEYKNSPGYDDPNSWFTGADDVIAADVRHKIDVSIVLLLDQEW